MLREDGNLSDQLMAGTPLLTGGAAAWKTEHPHHEHHHGVHVGDEAVAPHVRHLSEHEPSNQVLLIMQHSFELSISTSLERHVFGVALPRLQCHAHIVTKAAQWLIPWCDDAGFNGPAKLYVDPHLQIRYAPSHRCWCKRYVA